jgi:cell division protease FtsH
MNRLRSLAADLRMRLTLLPRLTRGLLVSLLALTLLLVAALFALRPSTEGKEISLTTLGSMIDSGALKEATLLDQDHVIIGRALSGDRFHTAYPSSDAVTTGFYDRMRDAGIPVRLDPQGGKASIRLLTTSVLPILLLANLFALLFTARSSGGGALGEVQEFGRLDREGRVGGSISFKDVAGVEEAQEELTEVVDYLRNPDRYASVGAVPPKGVLLFGPPGCGKTLLAKAVAGEAGVPFFSVAGAEFVESLVGVGAARVRDLFAAVRAQAPAIVFIDELDAAARRRGSGSGGGAEERDQTLNQMLVEMDGFDVSAGIVVMAATNRPDILDPALLRPGRFDRHVLIDVPDIGRREDILRLHAKGRPIAADVDFHELARQTPGFTGADLASVINEAALLTIRASHPTIDAPTLSEAVQRVLGGPQRRGHLLTDEERRRVACHEAGHAVVAALLGQAERVHRVSIVARGRGLGTMGLEREDRETIRTASQLRAKLAITLAGRAAEELLFGEASTGAEDDLEHATKLAREMAGRHGFAEEVGPVSVVAASGHLGNEEPFTGSEAAWSAFDAAVRRFVDEGRLGARTLLAGAGEAHGALTDMLLAEEQLEGEHLTSSLPAALEPDAVESALRGDELRV